MCIKYTSLASTVRELSDYYKGFASLNMAVNSVWHSFFYAIIAIDTLHCINHILMGVRLVNIQRDGSVTFCLLAGWNLLCLRTIWLGMEPLFNLILLFFLPIFWRSLGWTEVLLSGPLSINQATNILALTLRTGKYRAIVSFMMHSVTWNSVDMAQRINLNIVNWLWKYYIDVNKNVIYTGGSGWGIMISE